MRLWYCTVCPRRDQWTNLKDKHYTGGQLCPGEVRVAVYRFDCVASDEKGTRPMTVTKETWTLTLNDTEVEVPADHVLIHADVFARLAKAFDYIERTITEHGVKPERDGDHGLIHARTEARDCAAFCEGAPTAEKTTAVHWPVVG